MLLAILRQAKVELMSLCLTGFKTERNSDTVLTHAVLHHHEPTFVAFEALALKAARRVDTDSTSTEIRRNPALVDV